MWSGKLSASSCMETLGNTIWWISLGLWRTSPWGGLYNQNPFIFVVVINDDDDVASSWHGVI